MVKLMTTHMPLQEQRNKTVTKKISSKHYTLLTKSDKRRSPKFSFMIGLCLANVDALLDQPADLIISERLNPANRLREVDALRQLCADNLSTPETFNTDLIHLAIVSFPTGLTGLM